MVASVVELDTSVGELTEVASVAGFLPADPRCEELSEGVILQCVHVRKRYGHVTRIANFETTVLMAIIELYAVVS